MDTIIFGGVQMGKNRGQYTREFKTEAVRLIVEEGRRISNVVREFGIAEKLLRCWKKKSEEGRIGLSLVKAI